MLAARAGRIYHDAPQQNRFRQTSQEGSFMTSVLDRLRSLEDNYTERKLEGVNAADLRRSLVAFANSVPSDRPGILFLGVRDDGDIVGVSNSDALQKTIRRIAENDCYPPIRYACEVVRSTGVDVLAVIVPASTDRPHFAGAAFVRRGSESVAASPEMLDELIASRNSKAGALLRLGSTLLTVIVKGKELGSTKHLDDRRYRARHECRIESVNAHYVRMYDISSSRRVSEPLENITVLYDEERYRPMLIVELRDV